MESIMFLGVASLCFGRTKTHLLPKREKESRWSGMKMILKN